MSPIVREVGFLALGLAACLEAAIYVRWWAWGADLAAPILVAMFLLLQGAYYAVDGAAWTDLAQAVKSSRPATRFYALLSRRGSPSWRIDFAAMLCAAAGLGLSAQALASFEVHGATHGAEHHATQAWLLFAIGTCITAVFALSAWYWHGLNRMLTMPEAREFVALAARVWRGAEHASLFRWVFLAITLISMTLTASCLAIGPSVTLLVVVNLTMALLVGVYGFLVWRRPLRKRGAVFDTHT